MASRPPQLPGLRSQETEELLEQHRLCKAPNSDIQYDCGRDAISVFTLAVAVVGKKKRIVNKGSMNFVELSLSSSSSREGNTSLGGSRFEPF